MITDDRAGPDGQIIERVLARRSRSEAFTQVVPANEVAGRGVTNCGIDVTIAWTAQRAGRFQEEEVVEIAVINYPRVPDPMIIQPQHGGSSQQVVSVVDTWR
jgi:hypothetical protein